MPPERVFQVPTLGPRAVGYRIDRIKSLTGHDLNDVDDRFTRELAIRTRRISNPTGADHTAGGTI